MPTRTRAQTTGTSYFPDTPIILCLPYCLSRYSILGYSLTMAFSTMVDSEPVSTKTKRSFPVPQEILMIGMLRLVSMKGIVILLICSCFSRAKVFWASELNLRSESSIRIHASSSPLSFRHLLRFVIFVESVMVITPFLYLYG